MEALNCRLHALVALGRYPEAEAVVAEFSRLSPRLAAVAASAVQLVFGDVAGARATSERCVERWGAAEPLCWDHLVWCDLIRGDEERALARLHEVAATMPVGPARDGLVRLAWTHILFEHDRARIEARLGFALPPARNGTGAGVLPVLRTPAAAGSLRMKSARGWFTVPARVNGRRVRLIVDTGTDHLTLRASLARELGLTPAGRQELLSCGGAAPVVRDSYLVERLELDRLRIDGLPASSEDSPLVLRIADGILGTALFKDFVLDLDFPARRLRFAARRDPPPGAVALPFLWPQQLILVPGRVEGKLDAWWVLDSGGEMEFIDTRFLPALARVEVAAIATPAGAPPPIAFGLGGRAKGVYLSPFTAQLGRWPVRLARARAVDCAPESGVFALGAWGMTTLRHLRLVIDYPRQRIHLVGAPAGATDDAAAPRVPLGG